MKTLAPDTAVIIIDHGSKRAAANDMLLDVVALYKAQTNHPLVEAAHMELAAPTLEDAVATCADAGATRIVVHPYFLAPGRHSTGDIPRMVNEVATHYPHIAFHVTEPLGIAPQMAEVMQQRILEALS